MALTKKQRIERARKRMREGDLTDAQALARERSTRDRKEQERERKKIVKALEAELKISEERNAFLDALEAAPEPKPYRMRRRKGQGKSKPAASYTMAASDWHMGEQVDPAIVGGRNEYNPEIAQERAEQYFHSQLTMLKAARSAWDIRDGVLWLGGDLMTGYLHEENMESNYLSPVEEALLVHETFTKGIRFLLDRSDLDHILIPTSNGNHGRTGKKMTASTPAKNSFEWLTYQHLARTFADEPRVTFQIATGYHNVVDLYGMRIGFHHGDAIGYAGGIGGTAIPANRRIGRQALTIPPDWEGTALGACHLYIHGHFHQLAYPGLFIQNGSLIGWNPFADRIGAGYQDPQQFSFVVDERYRVVSNFNPILVTKPRKWAVSHS